MAGCPSAAASGAGRTWARCAGWCPARWRTASRHRRTSTRRLAERWPAVRDGVLAAIDWRTNARERSLERVLAERAQEEQERIADRLDRFAHTLRRKLAEEDTDLEQALISRAEVGKSRDELAQYRRDRRSWAERLDQLPQDRERELAAVARRYADPPAAPLPGGGRVRGAATGGRAMTRCTRRAAPSPGRRPGPPAPRLARAGRGHRPVPVPAGAAGDLADARTDRRGRARRPAPRPRRVARRRHRRAARLGRVRAGRPARLARRPAVGRRRGPDRPGGRPARARHDDQPVVRARRARIMHRARCAHRRGQAGGRAAAGSAVRPGAAAHGPDPGVGVGGDPGRPGGAAVPPPRRPARPGDRRPLVGAGPRAARRRHLGRGVRRRGLAGGSRPRRGAGVPLAAGAPPVLRGARRRAPPCAVEAQRGQPGRPHRGPRRAGSPGRRAAGDRDRPGRPHCPGREPAQRHRARGLPRRGVGDDARGVPAVRRGTRGCCPATTSCTRSRTRPAGWAPSWSSGRGRARRTSWRTPPPPGTGCSRCSPPCTTGSSTRA